MKFLRSNGPKFMPRHNSSPFPNILRVSEILMENLIKDIMQSKVLQTFSAQLIAGHMLY